MTRKCGRCTECCTAMGVVEIDKDHGVKCEHVGRRGCSIYAKRPDSCRLFKCGWLDGYGANADRPDKIGLVLSSQEGVHGEPIVKAYRTFKISRGSIRLDEIAEDRVVYIVDGDTRKVLGPEATVKRFFQAAGLGGATVEDFLDPERAKRIVDGETGN